MFDNDVSIFEKSVEARITPSWYSFSVDISALYFGLLMFSLFWISDNNDWKRLILIVCSIRCIILYHY